MKSDHDIITHEEMIELTGYQRPSQQCKALERAGIFFIKRPDGHPRTTWGHFQNPLSKRPQAPIQEEPNFGAM
ncbi:hypothetical protein A3Q29_16310 [Providencia stuartii]|uniref:DUF4224 domain-containing protein n=1 Tax=Providencia stuartii TaxID=588 RepID=A0A1S1HU68_PROST|nr:hypothetical protein A3Q29_16310 [Providencia stuartii]